MKTTFQYFMQAHVHEHNNELLTQNAHCPTRGCGADVLTWRLIDAVVPFELGAGRLSSESRWIQSDYHDSTNWLWASSGARIFEARDTKSKAGLTIAVTTGRFQGDAY